MSNIRLVVTDIDGTLVRVGEHMVSERVRQSVIACEDKGVKVVPVTGRPYTMAKPVLELLGFDGLGIFDNGATIQEIKTGEVVWSKWLDPQTTREVATALYPFSDLIYYEPGMYELELIEHEPDENELNRIAAVQEPASHVYALMQNRHVATVRELLEVVPGISYYFADPFDKTKTEHKQMQVTHIDATKRHSTAALHELEGVSPEHTLAIGDGMNDLVLFQSATVKVAMGNAVDELKTAADHVVATVDDDGFVEAMDRFVLS